MALLRTYRFVDKDPVCDELKTLISDEGLFDRLGTVATLANLHRQTLHNIFHGSTKRPQNATVMGIITCLGYERKFVKSRKLNVEEELVFAKQWNTREKAKRIHVPRKKKKRA
jgi:hypothetical protein